MTEKQIGDIEADLKVLAERVHNWMDTTTEYRKALCKKIDELILRLDTLPCKERSGIYKNLSDQIKVQWGVLILIIGAFIAEYFVK